MEHVESRTVLVGSGKLLEGAITLETIEELEAGLGFAPIDLDAVRGVVRQLRDRLEVEVRARRGTLCVSCGTVHLHTPGCRLMAEQAMNEMSGVSHDRLSSDGKLVALRSIDDWARFKQVNDEHGQRSHDQATVRSNGGD
ncbi:MAG: hypothetical protein NUW22_05180 [Acidobacteria bacterium]|nr:hypothetical protein [Acidobacteriota bacterium]